MFYYPSRLNKTFHFTGHRCQTKTPTLAGNSNFYTERSRSAHC